MQQLFGDQNAVGMVSLPEDSTTRRACSPRGSITQISVLSVFRNRIRDPSPEGIVSWASVRIRAVGAPEVSISQTPRFRVGSLNPLASIRWLSGNHARRSGWRLSSVRRLRLRPSSKLLKRMPLLSAHTRNSPKAGQTTGSSWFVRQPGTPSKAALGGVWDGSGESYRAQGRQLHNCHGLDGTGVRWGVR